MVLAFNNTFAFVAGFVLIAVGYVGGSLVGRLGKHKGWGFRIAIIGGWAAAITVAWLALYAYETP